MQIEIPSFDQAKVLVVGDIILDRYWSGSTSRISPEAPVPVVRVEDIEDRPGGAANVALNIAALGSQVWLCGLTGKDDEAKVIQNKLTAAGVQCHFDAKKELKTTTKLRVLSHNQQLIRLDFEQPNVLADQSIAPETLDTLIQQVDVVVLSDYNKGSLQHCEKIIQLVQKYQKPIIADPKGKNFSKYRGASLVTPNLSEFESIVGACEQEEGLIEKGHKLLQEIDLDALLITRGEQGMTLLTENEPELHLPARAKEVFDVTGAGDTVIATLAASLGAGGSLPVAVALANVAASIAVGKLGTATVSAPELRGAIRQQQTLDAGVMTPKQLLIATQDAKAQGEKIVFTNGCFDIIHAGHVGYLKQARQAGDRLIVAINTDESIQRLKGEDRPVNTLARRMAVLSALESVDWVTCFSEDTPKSLLQQLQPDVLVKGGDYQDTSEVVGGEIVKTYGGEVKVLGFFDNCSTTQTIEKIRKSRDNSSN